MKSTAHPRIYSCSRVEDLNITGEKQQRPDMQAEVWTVRSAWDIRLSPANPVDTDERTAQFPGVIYRKIL